MLSVRLHNGTLSAITSDFGMKPNLGVAAGMVITILYNKKSKYGGRNNWKYIHASL